MHSDTKQSEYIVGQSDTEFAYPLEQVYFRGARGDMSGAEQMVARMKSSQPAMYDKHMIGRNGRWVPRIDEMLKIPKPALVIVLNAQ